MGEVAARLARMHGWLAAGWARPSEEGHQPTLARCPALPAAGSLTMVVGGVGSGKSSLLGGLIGQLEPRKGSVVVGGSVAFVSQTAWICNDIVQVGGSCLGAPHTTPCWLRALLHASAALRQPPSLRHPGSAARLQLPASSRPPPAAPLQLPPSGRPPPAARLQLPVCSCPSAAAPLQPPPQLPHSSLPCSNSAGEHHHGRRL
jgi:energy-coupling factor transporter ATP-binding protein EcfA2